MKHCYLLFIGVICTFFEAFGQQTAQNTMYWFNPFQFNVAAAGTDQTLVATGVYRKQWNQLSGSPETQQLNAHLPLDIVRSGIGLKLQNDKIGAHTTTGGSLGYSYKVVQSKKMVVSVGLGAGILQYRLDGSLLRAPDGTYDELVGAFSHNDRFLPEGVVSAVAFSGEAGVWLQSEHLTLGVSATPIAGQAFRYKALQEIDLKQAMHLNFYAGTLFSITEMIDLEPFVLIKSDVIKTESDLSFKASYNKSIFAGVNLRGLGFSPLESLGFFVGSKINPNTILSYSFDSVISPLKSASGGSHELSIRYTLSKPLGVGKLPPVIYNPRFQ